MLKSPHKKIYDRQYRVKLRSTVLIAYGNKCTCCGEDCQGVLQMDHVDGGGRTHVSSLGGSKGFYKWLCKENFPPAYKILCANCNLGKFRNRGQCPHQGVNPFNGNEGHRRYRVKLRDAVFNLLGAACSMCSESNVLFLTIDHINGRGNVERKSIKDNDQIYIKIRDDESYREGFQLMCMNCNVLKYRQELSSEKTL